MDSIPVVDIELISKSDGVSEDDWKSISTEVDRVLTSIGFVYLKNHGVPQKIIDEAFAKSRDFYSLESQVKKKYGKKMDGVMGYVEPSQEILEPGKFNVALRESFDISLNKGFKLKGQEPIPEAQGFVSALFSLGIACHPLIERLHRIIAQALQLDDIEYFNNVSKAFSDPTVTSYSTIRSIFYPPITKDVTPGSVRCAPHSDYGTITLLFQDEIGGLEVQRVDGSWMPATPIPGTILVNLGDLLNFWSGGRYPATIHRVLIPEIETKKRLARQSIVYFVHPDSDVMVSPIGPLAKNLEQTAAVSASEHARKRFENTYRY